MSEASKTMVLKAALFWCGASHPAAAPKRAPLGRGPSLSGFPTFMSSHVGDQCHSHPPVHNPRTGATVTDLALSALQITQAGAAAHPEKPEPGGNQNEKSHDSSGVYLHRSCRLLATVRFCVADSC